MRKTIAIISIIMVLVAVCLVSLFADGSTALSAKPMSANEGWNVTHPYFPDDPNFPYREGDPMPEDFDSWFDNNSGGEDIPAPPTRPTPGEADPDDDYFDIAAPTEPAVQIED